MVPTLNEPTPPGAPKPLALSEVVASRLAGHIRACWSEAAMYKQQQALVELLKCDRQRKGEYEPEDAKAISEIGGSDIYMMISDIKANGAESWIKDVIASAGDRPYDLEPANNPQLPPEMAQMIADFVMVEAQPFIQEGAQIHPEAFRERMEEVHDTLLVRIKEEAKQAAERHSGVIEDQLKEGGFKPALNSFIRDFCTYPTAILKGPVVRKKNRLTWGPRFEALVVEDFMREVCRVSPYDIYPSPGSRGPNDGYLIERHRMTVRQLNDLIGLPGYNAGEIAAAIAKYGRTGLRCTEAGDFERAELENKPSYGFFVDTKIEALEYWGPVLGSMLREWGFKGKVEDTKVYEINAWLVGGHVIKATMNPDPLGRRPYHTASWTPVPDSFWGNSLMKKCRDVQRMCNNAARSLANNIGVSSGPQVDISVDRLPDGEKLTEMYPWKIWQTTSDRTGANQPAIRFFQPNMNAKELMDVYQTFMRQADEVTGIPNYIYGGQQASGAGRTASGLSMLMDNAAKGIKQGIGYVDAVISAVISSMYIHNMMYHPDPYIKGDFKIVSRGALGVLVKENLQVRRNEFLNLVITNPIASNVIGEEGIAYLLREIAQHLEMDTDRLVPTTEMLRFKQRQAQAKAQAMAAQGLDPNGQPLPQAPPPTSQEQLPGGMQPGGPQPGSLMQPMV